MWKEADNILPRGGIPGGKEYLRFTMRNSLIEGIAIFESLYDKLGASEKKVSDKLGAEEMVIWL